MTPIGYIFPSGKSGGDFPADFPLGKIATWRSRFEITLSRSEFMMKEFTFSDLSRRSCDVLDAAMVGPVSLMKRGKAKVVMMPTAEYERLVTGRRDRNAFTLADAQEEDVENLMTGFQQIIDDAGRPE